MKLNIYKTLHQRTGVGKTDIEEIRFLETVILYDQNQNVIKEEVYSSDGEISTYTVNQYDDHNKLLSMAMYDGENVLCQKSEYQYNSDYKLIKQNDFFGEELIEYTTVFIYENNVLVKEEIHEDNQFLSIQKEYFYKDGKLYKQIDYDEFEKVQYIQLFSYNEKGLLTQRIREEIQAKDRRTYDIFYNEKNLKIKELTYNYDDILIEAKYYAYNVTLQLIEEEEENLDSYKKTVYIYNGEQHVKSEVVDKNGNIIQETKIEYDSNGNEHFVRIYQQDEVSPEELRIYMEIEYDRIKE